MTRDKLKINGKKAQLVTCNLKLVTKMGVREKVDLNFTVDQDIYGNDQKKPQTVKFIDWDNVDNNDFLVTRQLEVKTQLGKSIYPDIVIFVNGIPVAVLECKSPFLEKTKNESIGKKEAFEQLRRYMNERNTNVLEGNPRLFYTNFFTGILRAYP